MKTGKLFNIIMLVAIFAFTFTGCKKDNSSSSSSTAGDVTQANAAQDAETQDAISTKVENTADNQADQLENNNFSASYTSQMLVQDTSININGVTINVNHPDTTYFPKVITFVFNVNDTVNGVIMTQTGTIQLTVDTIPVHKKLWWRKHVSRVFVFTNYTVSNDSNSFSISGTRTMNRQNWTAATNGTGQLLRVVMKDTVSSALNITVTSGNTSVGTFTRNVARTRVTTLHYWKLLPKNIGWHPNITADTVNITGSVTGNNLQDLAYSRVITTPLVYSVCPEAPFNLILTGVIKDTEDCSKGTAVITITYTADGCTTSVTATDSNGKTVKIDRHINRGFHKWW